MTRQMTLFDCLDSQINERSREILAVLSCVLGSFLIALSSQVQFAIPGSMVPITAQTMVVITLGMVLGPRLGIVAAGLYLLECLLFPGFSASGRIVMTGGYIVGFIPAAWIAGHFFRHGYGQNLLRSLLTMFAANLVILVTGTVWLYSLFLPLDEAIYQGFTIFLVVDSIKIVLMTPLMLGLSSVARSLERRLK